MLSAPAIDLTFDSDDDWIPDPPQTRLYRAASVGNSWGVTSMGRGFDWDQKTDEIDPLSSKHESLLPPPKLERSKSDHDADVLAAAKRRNRNSQASVKLTRPISTISSSSQRPPTPSIITQAIFAEPASFSTDQSRSSSPRPMTPGSIHSTQRNSPTGSRPPTSPRPRRRSSQQRVSLVAGRVLIAPMESPVMIPPSLHRGSGAKNLINTAAGVQTQPLHNKQSFLGDRNISEFVIEKEIGRGAYGLVKLAREIQPDGSLGVRYMAYSIVVRSATLNTGVASAGHQTNYQVSYTCRLLETASKVWHHSD